MRTKQIGKEMHTVYISKKITFKKESETIEAAIKDKQIEKKKKVIINLLKTHATINDKLNATRSAYRSEKQSYQKKHSELIQEKSIAYNSMLRLKIRKFRIQAFENPKIKRHFQNDLKKYLMGWAQANKYQFVFNFGGIQNYRIVKKFAKKIEINCLLRPGLKKIVLLKHQTIFNQNCKTQPIIVSIKINEPDQKGVISYRLQIYSTKGKYFFLSRNLTKLEYETQIQHQNPLKNVRIMFMQLHFFVRKKSIVFLTEYFRDEANVKKIQRILKLCKFQIDVLREKKKYILFRVLTIKNIFQSIYQVEGYKNLELEVLLGIKKKEVVRSNQQELSIYSNGANRKMNRYGRQKGMRQTQQKVQKKYIFYCEPILSYAKKYMFRIQDQNLFKNNEISPENFLQTFENKFMIQLRVKKSLLRQQIHVSQQIKLKVPNSQYNFTEELKKFQKEIINPQVVRVLDFTVLANMKKLIKLQSLLKMRLLKKKYQQELKRLKKENLYAFCCKIQDNIIICSFIKGDKLIYFVECLSLSADRKRDPHQYLNYPKKYWKLAQEFMKSEEIAQISKKSLIWEIQEQISVCFEEIIKKFEEQQLIINEMKPIKALNRLRRLFVRATLRRKKKANICFIRKLQKQFATLVLILRKSPYLKNITQAHLYVLKIKPKKSQSRFNKQKLSNFELEQRLNRNRTFIKLESLPKQKRSNRCLITQEKKIKYQPISMFTENVNKLVTYVKETCNFQNSESAYGRFKKVIEKCVSCQFYITETNFLLKPLHLEYITGQLKFIQRFASVNLGSDQILNEVENSSYMKNGGQSYVCDQILNTIIKEKQFIRGSKKSTPSIIFDNLQSFREQQNSQKNLVFYSLYKDKSSRFFLELFIIAQSSTTNSFKQVLKEEISKKQICTSSWAFVYKIIATWMRTSSRYINYEEYLNVNRRDVLGYYYPASNKNESSAEEPESVYQEPQIIFNH